jgi:hypothetical protein
LCIVGLYVSPPATLHTVELKQVGRRRSTALDFIQMHHIKSIA